MVNVNSIAVRFRVVDASGQPVPSLTVTGPDPTAPLDIKAGESMAIGVTVNNPNNGTFRLTDAVPRLQIGQPVLSSASCSFDAAVGDTAGSVTVVARADARIGDEGEYLIDLVAEAV